MPVSDIVLLLGAVGVLVTTIAGAIMTLRRVETVKAEVETVKAEVETSKSEIKEGVEAVHKIVNQHQTDMLAYQQLLVDTLTDKGIHVPRDVSVEQE